MTTFPVTILVGVIILVLFSQASLAQQCSNGEIRLARNSTPFEGGIDVCVGTVWGTVCNDFWGPNEVRIACRQLGFQVSGRETFIDLIIEGGPEILIDNINCTGSEQTLTDCMFSPEVSDCLGNVTNKVGVRCHEERPPQNISVIASEVDLNVTWEEPLSDITSDPILGYNIECSISITPDNNIQYKASGAVQSATTSIIVPLENLQFNLHTVYNCCVEVEYEAYSSIACASERSTQDLVSTTTSSETSTISEQLETASSTSRTIGGILGAIILILTLLLVLSLAGLLYMYRRVKIAEEERENLDGAITRVSEFDAPERIVENPTYGENDAPRQNTYEGVEQYSRTGPDYEPMERDPNTEVHYTSLEEATVPHIEYASDT